jgi:hypothetical protein
VDVLVERCAFLDVHRDTVMACARTPDGVGGRREEVMEFRTTLSQLGFPPDRGGFLYAASSVILACFSKSIGDRIPQVL